MVKDEPEAIWDYIHYSRRIKEQEERKHPDREEMERSDCVMILAKREEEEKEEEESEEREEGKRNKEREMGEEEGRKKDKGGHQEKR